MDGRPAGRPAGCTKIYCASRFKGKEAQLHLSSYLTFWLVYCRDVFFSRQIASFDLRVKQKLVLKKNNRRNPFFVNSRQELHACNTNLPWGGKGRGCADKGLCKVVQLLSFSSHHIVMGVQCSLRFIFRMLDLVAKGIASNKEEVFKDFDHTDCDIFGGDVSAGPTSLLGTSWCWLMPLLFILSSLTGRHWFYY